MKRWIPYITAVFPDLIAYAIVVVLWALWGQRLQWKHGCLTMEFKKDSWPTRTWYKDWGGTTFGHGIIYNYDHLDWEPIWLHELVHVEQYEAECLQNFIVFVFCCVASYWVPWLWMVGTFQWGLGALMGAMCGYATAWLRGEDLYRGSHLEEAARAVATCKKRGEVV